jgi:hypothetical protein
MGTIINISDLLPVKHGEAVLKVDAKRAGPRTSRGFRGYVLVEFPKTPQANYTVPVEGDALRLADADATADAIALRKDLITQNLIVKKEA